MKIDIITMHGVYNYGSALQTYATKSYLERKGHEVEIIDYYPGRMRHYGSISQLFRDANTFHHNAVKSAIISCVKYCSIPKLKRAFIPFATEHFLKTDKFESNEEIKKNPPKADVYCTGSDQVWNDYLERGFDSTYFLDFAPEEAKKIAFSASFGRDDIKPEELKTIQKYLNKYNAISVREDSGLQALTGTPVDLKACVLDPSFMLTGEEWKKLAPIISEKGYILVYKLHEDSIASEAALEIGKREGKPVIRISLDYMKRIKGGKTVVAPEVTKFISYIANADLVVTDSFHATAFSINLNVPFVSIQWKMFNDRIGTILKKTNLCERRAASVEEALMIYREKIDFDDVNMRLDHERELTDEFMEKALS